MEIIKDITTRNRTVSNSRSIKFIAIHYVGAVSSAKANAAYFKSTYRGASAHYFVDDSSIYQVVEDKDVAWHVGASSYKHPTCRNSNSIGIEMCCFNNGGKLDVSQAVVSKTIALTKELMAKYNIPAANVVRHYDVTGKNCPAPFVSSPARWTSFKNSLGGSATAVSVTSNNNDGSDEKVRVYQNGSTAEPVYADTSCTNKIGSLDPRESCDCFGTFNGRAMVRYRVGSSNNYKIGFVKWVGGVK